MVKIQVVFKGRDKDIIISGENLDEVIKEYDAIKEKMEKLILPRPTKPPERKTVAPTRASASARILALKNEGFFEKPKDIGEIQGELATKGYHYAQTSLSGPLLELVRKNELRRYSEQRDKRKIWVYVNP